MAFKLNSYEGQAKLSVGLAVVGGLAAVFVLGLLFRNFETASFYVTYNAKGPWLPMVGLALLVGLAAGTAGFLMALNSAGQRRNTLSTLAWQGFFLNALVVTIVLGAAVFLVFTRNPIEFRPG